MGATRPGGTNPWGGGVGIQMGGLGTINHPSLSRQGVMSDRSSRVVFPANTFLGNYQGVRGQVRPKMSSPEVITNGGIRRNSDLGRGPQLGDGVEEVVQGVGNHPWEIAHNVTNIHLR